MKEMINFCMTKHEPLIRQLAETPLGGQRFELLIRRYEMNNEPPPPDEPKAEKYVTISRCHIIVSVLIYFLQDRRSSSVAWCITRA